MKKRPVNLGRSDENIADQYLNIFEGLQKDAGQNSWDARLTKKGKDWKLLFRYLKEHNTLIIEDFGTSGMDEKKWIAYQSLWDTTKIEDESLGSRGQGKFLFHYFSSNKLVLTESIDRDRKYRFSFGTPGEYEDEDKNLKEFFPSANTLDHQGTRIRICNVKKDFLRELLDVTQFMKYIAATWWEIIINWNAIFVVDLDGVDRAVKVPDMPKINKGIHLQNIKIKDMGMIRNLVIRFCHDEVPEEFRGIAIQRGGMAILRIPIQAEESLKNKIYGYCNFDDALESELKKLNFLIILAFQTNGHGTTSENM